MDQLFILVPFFNRVKAKIVSMIMNIRIMANAKVISMSDTPRIPYRNAFTMYKIGLIRETPSQKSGSNSIE